MEHPLEASCVTDSSELISPQAQILLGRCHPAAFPRPDLPKILTDKVGKRVM